MYLSHLQVFKMISFKGAQAYQVYLNALDLYSDLDIPRWHYTPPFRRARCPGLSFRSHNRRGSFLLLNHQLWELKSPRHLLTDGKYLWQRFYLSLLAKQNFNKWKKKVCSINILTFSFFLEHFGLLLVVIVISKN